MSDTSLDRSSELADRPAEVTDPLLWKLALEVADAHEPDEDGGCRNLLCAGQSWPCEPWNRAQHALHVAQASPAEVAPTVTAAPAEGQGPLTGPAAALRGRPPAQRSPEAAVPAA